MNDPTGNENGPASVGAETRPDLKPCLVGESQEHISRGPAVRQALAAAALAALPIDELQAQTLGTRLAFGTHARPGRIEGITRSSRLLLRAAEHALESNHDLQARHMEAALRSLALSPSALLVCSMTGQWLSSREAVANRAREVSRALGELARIVANVESEADHG